MLVTELPLATDIPHLDLVPKGFEVRMGVGHIIIWDPVAELHCDVQESSWNEDSVRVMLRNLEGAIAFKAAGGLLH